VTRWRWVRHDWHKWRQHRHHEAQKRHRREAHRHMKAAQWILTDYLGDP
jgi:hypothetical protein